jgi:hypothetical protein
LSTTTHDYFDDPMNDARRELLRGMAQISTVLEAGARWVAVGIQKKAADEERKIGDLRRAEAWQRRADALRDEWLGEREKLAATLDTSGLDDATFAEAATVWRTAGAHAAHAAQTGQRDPVAATLTEKAMDRMRELQPDLMERYDRQRAAGHSPAEAMRNVHREMWEEHARENGKLREPSARPHPGREPDPARTALPAGSPGDLDRAVRAELAAVTGNVSPAAVEQIQQRLRDGGAKDAADALDPMRRACPPDSEAENRFRLGDAARKEGRSASGAADDPATPVDEHSVGQQVGAERTGDADQLDALAGRANAGRPVHVGEVLAKPQRPAASAAFPNRLRVGTRPAGLERKREADATVTHSPTRRNGR